MATLQLNVLPIEKDGIKKKPNHFLIDIAGLKLIFKVGWNNQSEEFYFDLFDINNEPLIKGQRIVYGIDFFENIEDPYIGRPEIIIFPIDLKGEYDRITYDNFMNDVKPYIFTGEE